MRTFDSCITESCFHSSVTKKARSLFHKVVRILYNEVKLFPTRQRIPFLILFETVSQEESTSKEPEFEKDFDYLRSKYNILTPDKILEDVKEDFNQTKNKENLNFKELKNYLSKEKDLLDKNMVEVKFNPGRKSTFRSKSVEVFRRGRIPKNKSNDYMNMRKLQKLSEKEIRNRISFILQLLKSSKSKGLAKLNIEYLEKLKEILTLMILKKQKRNKQLNQATESDYIDKIKQAKNDSPYGKFDSHRLRAYIVKSGDDMRQESLIIHFISIIRDIFIKEKINIFLMDLDFILLSKSSAMIEFIPDSNSIHNLKKIYNDKNLFSIYKVKFSSNFHEAQKNFVESLAGYSLLCYLFQIKDRHNSNILIDSVGHIIHIDFGFCLSATPGNMGFETAPFKFTQEYLDIMGGTEDYMYYYFRTLLFKAFEVLKKYTEEICSVVEIMRLAEIACFYKFDIKSFESRFHRFLLDQERWDLVDRLMSDSFTSRRTVLYDQFQKYSNNIEY